MMERIELDTLSSLIAAVAILDRASRAAINEPQPIWLKVHHAKRAIERQIAQLIGDPSKES